MKDLIEKKLEEHGKSVIEKETLSMDDINFLIYLLNRIEIKENAAVMKEEQKERDRIMREKMSTLIETTIGR